MIWFEVGESKLLAPNGARVSGQRLEGPIRTFCPGPVGGKLGQIGKLLVGFEQQVVLAILLLRKTNDWTVSLCKFGNVYHIKTFAIPASLKQKPARGPKQCGGIRGPIKQIYVDDDEGEDDDDDDGGDDDDDDGDDDRTWICLCQLCLMLAT